MKTVLSWKKSAFSSTYRIYSGDESIGQLQYASLKKTSRGNIRGKHYLFTTKGFFKQETLILDGETDKPIGNIEYGSWRTKASIRLSGRTVNWKYDNLWQTRWSLFDERGVHMSFAGGATKGTIEYDQPDDLLLLTGLFVTNYYQQAMIAVLLAVFIPIWVSLGN
jgi:hypothetical protein